MKKTEVDYKIQRLNISLPGVVNEDNEHMIRYIIVADVCHIETLMKLLKRESINPSLLTSCSNYSEYLDKQSVKVVDSTMTIQAMAEIYRVVVKSEVYRRDKLIYVDSITANCYVSLYKLLKHINFYGMIIPKELEVKVTS